MKNLNPAGEDYNHIAVCPIGEFAACAVISSANPKP